MLSDKETVRASKFLSLVLRHQPQLIELKPDSLGWVPVDGLLLQMKNKGFHVDRNTLQRIVDTNSKKRFAFNEDKTKIRAVQGHSLAVDLQYDATVPPTVLFHGTAEKNCLAILKEGIQKMSRQHVHLSSDPKTATQVGSRHGKPVVLEVLAGIMHADGFSFFLSENGVWLTGNVPATYVRLPQSS